MLGLRTPVSPLLTFKNVLSLLLVVSNVAALLFRDCSLTLALTLGSCTGALTSLGMLALMRYGNSPSLRPARGALISLAIGALPLVSVFLTMLVGLLLRGDGWEQIRESIVVNSAWFLLTVIVLVVLETRAQRSAGRAPELLIPPMPLVPFLPSIAQA